MQFQNPDILYLLVVIPLIIAYYIFVNRRRAAMRVSTLGGERMPRTLRYWLRDLPMVLRLSALAVLIVALARPVEAHSSSESSTEGIDIVLAMDISGSMLAKDFEPDRITASKHLASEFAAERIGDRISVVAFAGEAFTQCPLTSDQATVETMLARLRSGVIDDGTAIGNGLANAVARLKDSPAKSRVIILLTDGVNNRGEVAPQMAIEIAKTYGIRVYTIGVGKRGYAPYPYYDAWGNVRYQQQKVEIDEQTLTDIAAKTGGEYFRATDKRALADIYERINNLEKTRIETDNYTRQNEHFAVWLLWALVVLVLEELVRRLWINKQP